MSGGTSERSHGLAKEKHSEEREIQGKGKRVDTEEWEVVRHKKYVKLQSYFFHKLSGRF